MTILPDHTPRFKFDIGPAFLAILIQTVGMVIWGTMVYATLANTTANTKLAADRLELIVEHIITNQEKTGERLIKVETNVDAITGTIKAIDLKLDQLKGAK